MHIHIVYTYAYMCVCIYMYMYVYIYIHTYTLGGDHMTHVEALQWLNCIFTGSLRANMCCGRPIPERLAEYGWKPHRDLFGSNKSIVGLNILVYA